MKKIAMLFLITTVFISGCGSREGLDVIKCRNAVNDEYPNSNISDIPSPSGHNEHLKYCFLIRKENGEVLYAYCGSCSSPKITSKVKLFNAIPQLEKLEK